MFAAQSWLLSTFSELLPKATYSDLIPPCGILKFILPPKSAINWKLISSTWCFQGLGGARAQQCKHSLLFPFP